MFEAGKIGSRGAHKVATAVSELSHLASLDLCNNLIREDGIPFLSDLLASTHTLTNLDLSCR